jgi:hypothetical protein
MKVSWLVPVAPCNHAGNLDSLLAFVRRAYAPSELAARPAEAVARGHRLWRQNYEGNRERRELMGRPVVGLLAALPIAVAAA